MNKPDKLSDVWLKASILGANWAASEIILGSFLHNLHIPFKGNILTAIGLVLMISVAYKWQDRGLFWRTGLICALMKTMSPSAVILGPMVAIFMEAFLLDASVRILGRNTAGFFLGSALAMSWVLAQKIINLIIFYGNNIVEIYSNLLKYTEQQLNIQFDTFWLPILFLLGIYILFGLLAALAGMKIARGVAKVMEIEEKGTSYHPVEVQKHREDFSYSVTSLLLSFAGIVVALILINYTAVFIWMPSIAALVMIWVLRYKRAMRQLSRPRFWIFFIFITVLSAMLITSFNGNQNKWQDGLMIGLQMNFRAAVIIVGFSVLGTELYNPRIRNFLARTSFKQLPQAMELAFESLPFIIAHLPEASAFIRKPMAVIQLLIRYAEAQFNTLKEPSYASVFIISGKVSEGKTRFITDLNRRLRDRQIATGGFYARRVMQDGQTLGYDLVRVDTGEAYNFLAVKRKETANHIGKYEINTDTLEIGKRTLAAENIQGKDVVFLDEIGRLELNGDGWSKSLEKLLAVTSLCLVITVRKDYLDQVLRKYNLHHAMIFHVSSESIVHAETMILNKILNQKPVHFR